MSDSEPQPTLISAGEQLRHLREQKNYSVQDIASKLNLESRIIEAIENNNFESLHAATYVRGYLRSYAKILGIDPELILASYNNNAPEPPEIIPEVKHSTQTSSSDKPVRAFTYLVSLTLVILLVAWLYSTYIIKDSATVTATPAPAELENVPSGLSYEFPVIEHSQSPYFREPEVLAEEPAVAVDPGDLISPAEEVTVMTDEEDSGYALRVTTDSEGPDSLVLSMLNDSWIEVFDSLGNKVFVNLGRKDQVLELKGTAPFSILLGFSEGVRIEFNGEPFDAQPYTKGSIARFTLDR